MGPRWLVTVAAVVAFGLFAGQASASPGALKVLLAFSDGAHTEAMIKGQIAALPGVATVDTFDTGAATPTLAQLETYDVVVPYSVTAYSDPVTLGDNLAGYEDGGGVVVATSFNWHFLNNNFRIAGSWITGGYSPYDYSVMSDYSFATLGVHDSSNPLLDGVTALRDFYREDQAVAAGATEIAKWSDGRSAVAFKGRAVGVNACLADGCEDFSGDFARIIVNAANVFTPHAITISKAGSGAGNVESGPFGINCGTSCAATFLFPQQVTLTPTPHIGSKFTGWSGGGCQGTGPCTVTAGPARNVTATFDLVPPAASAAVVSQATQTHRRWREPKHPKLARVSRKRAPVGTTFTFTLDKAAAVRFAFTTRARGRRAGGKCGPPTRRNRSKRRCTRTVKSGGLSFAGHSGINTVSFQGRDSRRKKYKPGRYTLTIRATTPGVGSTSQKLHFTIVK